MSPEELARRMAVRVERVRFGGEVPPEHVIPALLPFATALLAAEEALKTEIATHAVSPLYFDNGHECRHCNGCDHCFEPNEAEPCPAVRRMSAALGSVREALR